jgi:hypothetical protein
MNDARSMRDNGWTPEAALDRIVMRYRPDFAGRARTAASVYELCGLQVCDVDDITWEHVESVERLLRTRAQGFLPRDGKNDVHR